MLMNNLMKEIRGGINLRKNLISLREIIKDEEQKKTLACQLAGDFSVFTELLSHEDSKVRKNAAYIMADMECEDLSVPIWEAYCREKTLYIRGDLIKALSRFDCSAYLEQMRGRMEEMKEMTPLPEEEKHFNAEYTQLKHVILANDPPEKHRFTGFGKRQEIILMTNRNQREATRNQIEEPVKYLAGGIRFQTDNMKPVLTIRTYSEMLFPVLDCPVLTGSPEHMAELLMQSDLYHFLRENHNWRDPFYFRLEVKAPLSQDQRIDLVKKLSVALERASKGKLMNATSEYEVELRLVAGRDGRFIPLMKLFTLPDWRFTYRRESLPTSIAPVNAALIMELAGEYFTEHAQVLDPFCGAGTMLIERNMKLRTKSLYGIDILEEAVQKARVNAEEAHMQINFINRDFMDFHHDYLFDEVITNLPAEGKNRDRESVQFLYNRFLDKLPEVIKDGAFIVAYCPSHRNLLECLRNRKEYRMLKEYCLNERDDSYVHIIRFARKED